MSNNFFKPIKKVSASENENNRNLPADSNTEKETPPYQGHHEIFTSRKHGMDYFTTDGVILRTGYKIKRDWYLLPIREMLDNDIDFLWKYYKGSDKANPNLIDELTTPEEMSALLSLVLKRLPCVLQKGISSKSTIEENYVKYMQSSDPIKLFMDMAIMKVDVSEDKRLTKDEVYEAYERFCADKKLSKESSQTFSRRLGNDGFKYKPKKIDGRKTYVWIDIELKDYRQADEEQATFYSGQYYDSRQ